MSNESEHLLAQCDPAIPLDNTDLANEIGLLMGCIISDKAALERDFQQGFAHGVDLARCKRCEE